MGRAPLSFWSLRFKMCELRQSCPKRRYQVPPCKMGSLSLPFWACFRNDRWFVQSRSRLTGALSPGVGVLGATSHTNVDALGVLSMRHEGPTRSLIRGWGRAAHKGRQSAFPGPPGAHRATTAEGAVSQRASPPRRAAPSPDPPSTHRCPSCRTVQLLRQRLPAAAKGVGLPVGLLGRRKVSLCSAVGVHT